jgi:hypothetical protein
MAPHCPCGAVDDLPHRLLGCHDTQVNPHPITPHDTTQLLARIEGPYATRKPLR